MKSCPPNSLTLLAVTSIILVICIWPIICYNFVLNCMQLLVDRLAYSNNSGENYQVIDNYQISTAALNITMHAGLIISEGVLVLGLVVQFMSSFDYLTGNGQEYEHNWWRCHKKVLLLTAIILIVKLFISFLFMDLDSTSSVMESLLELYAIAINFIFLVISLNLTALRMVTRSSTEQSHSSPSENLNSHSVHVESFLDSPPAYEDLHLDKKKSSV